MKNLMEGLEPEWNKNMGLLSNISMSRDISSSPVSIHLSHVRHRLWNSVEYRTMTWCNNWRCRLARGNPTLCTTRCPHRIGTRTTMKSRGRDPERQKATRIRTTQAEATRVERLEGYSAPLFRRVGLRMIIRRGVQAEARCVRKSANHQTRLRYRVDCSLACTP